MANQLTYADRSTLTASQFLKYDHRSYVRYAWDLIMTKHSIFNTFVLNSVLKPKGIRIILFFLSISLQFAMNAAFYSDDYIVKRGLDYYSQDTVSAY